MTATWARALGARGAVRLKAGHIAEGLADLAEVLETYHRDGDSAVAPAAAVAQAQHTAIRHLPDRRNTHGATTCQI